MHDWELVRKDALKQVHATFAMKAHTRSFTLVKPNDEQLFLISAQVPLELTAHYRMWANAHLTIFTLLLLVFIKLA